MIVRSGKEVSVMQRWSSGLEVRRGRVQVLVKDRGQGDVLKASLPLRSHHPRALLTLLEGLALYQGGRLDAVIVAEPNCPSWHESGLFGDELWPAASPLVRFEVVAHGRREQIGGVGDFRALRRLWTQR